MRGVRLCLLLILVAALLPAGPRSWVPAAAAAETVLPAGFRLETLETGHEPYTLAAFAFLPDGSLLTLGRSGIVRVTPTGGAPRQLGTIPGVHVERDVGAIGLALAPDYATTGAVYVAYPYATDDGLRNRVSRWTLSPPQAPSGMAGEHVVLDGIRQDVSIHGLGTLALGPDGALYVGLGDAGSAGFVDSRSLRAQSLDQPYGKILRVDPTTGAGLPDNPFFQAAAPSSWRSRVYAYGLRNPFRFSFDPATGRMLAGDVGWTAYEEVDHILPGGNYGWPCFEGASRVAGHAPSPTCVALYARADSVIGPLVVRDHRVGQGSITGGTWYHGDSYPEAYRGAYFYADYTARTLWTMRLDDQGRVAVPPEPDGFGTGVGGPVDIRVGPHGDLYFADILSGLVQRLRYAPGNRPPTAVLRTSVDAETLTVTFDARGSADLDGDDLTYAWDFGDGSSASGPTPPAHTYANPGTYTVALTVTDTLGGTARTSTTVLPHNHPPVVTIGAAPARTYAVGDPVELSATASDVEDGSLTVRWQPVLQHCPENGGCHAHPEEARFGPTYAEPFADHGDATYLEVEVSAVDSAGVTSTQTYEAHPELRTLTVLSPVPALVNGRAQVASRVAVGSTNSVLLPAVSGPLRFVSRSDGEAADAAVTMPAEDVAITAVYESAIDERRRELGPTSFLGAALGPEVDVHGGRTRPYAGGDLYWSAATGARYVKGAIRRAWVTAGGVRTHGFPVTDESAVAGGWQSVFQRSTFIWSAATHTRFVRGSIRAKYLAVGGPDGRLGLPRANEAAIQGGYRSVFQQGDIYWGRTTGAHVVSGPIRSRWLGLRGHRGRLGFPSTDVVTTKYGARASFQGGVIRWYQATRTTTVAFSR